MTLRILTSFDNRLTTRSQFAKNADALCSAISKLYSFIPFTFLGSTLSSIWKSLANKTAVASLFENCGAMFKLLTGFEPTCESISMSLSFSSSFTIRLSFCLLRELEASLCFRNCLDSSITASTLSSCRDCHSDRHFCTYLRKDSSEDMESVSPNFLFTSFFTVSNLSFQLHSTSLERSTKYSLTSSG